MRVVRSRSRRQNRRVPHHLSPSRSRTIAAIIVVLLAAFFDSLQGRQREVLLPKLSYTAYNQLVSEASRMGLGFSPGIRSARSRRFLSSVSTLPAMHY
jgi:hypothetical protein